ncbi:hypothetical protein [Clostridium sp. CMCC3677]|uniref:hypothetical protein n=1 Tax=Clostridium sp. CMCC3677 TaxID=2949963 RepID=UPI0013F1045A|nr:hypothetical protein [Clostridium sp. CMCC3677]NFG61058.1 hypothetical protein [Clostridium botulinum]NFQ09357.1 hypothetical protein [Clostridium botulinum]
MLFQGTPRVKDEVELKFNSTYPVYLKIWSWATKNLNKFNDYQDFSYFKKWENEEFTQIFRNFQVREVFGSVLIEFVKYVYFYHIPPELRDSKLKVEHKETITEIFTVVIGNYYFNFMKCANSIILCDISYNEKHRTYYWVQDFLGYNDTYLKNTKKDSYVQYMNNVWFVNTNVPFMSYPDGILDNNRQVNKSKNIPFFNDFKKSYFNNYRNIDNSSEWYEGCKKVISAINPQFIWEFVEYSLRDERIVIVTGFKRNAPFGYF